MAEETIKPQLRGWDYTGRNVGHELHDQFRRMIDLLMTPAFVNHRSWGTDVQEDIAKGLGVSSSGAIRTIKKMYEMFGFFERDALNSRDEIDSANLLSERGTAMYGITKLEYQVEKDDSLDEKKRKDALAQIKLLYEEVYCDALSHYYYTNNDGSHLCPLRTTLFALNKYGKLDKWEWYLLNTFVRHDENETELREFYNAVERYRSGRMTFSMDDVVEKPKGHQYIPQYFEYAGLVHVVQRPDWSISKSNKHNDTKDIVLSSTFLDELYGRVGR